MKLFLIALLGICLPKSYLVFFLLAAPDWCLGIDPCNYYNVWFCKFHYNVTTFWIRSFEIFAYNYNKLCIYCIQI